jgi:hypothetical protein
MILENLRKDLEDEMPQGKKPEKGENEFGP